MDTSAPDGRVWEVVVIGAGQAGLATAHDLARRGLVPGRDFLVLDASMGPGGAWRERWDSLSLGRAHAIADLPGLALGPADPSVPASEVVAAYYRRYEERFALSVLRPARVTAVRPTDLPARPLLVGEAGPGRVATGPDEGDPGPDEGDPGVAALAGSRGEPDRSCSLLSVEAEVGGTGQRFLTRMVVSAAGTWTRPYIPWVPGASQFRGTQLHTVGYRRAEDFAGRRVVVVGGGLSAVQFLLELAPVAETIWATRRPPNFTDVAFDQEWGAGVERAVQQRTSGGQLPASVVRTTGIPREPAYLRAIEAGILVSRGMFDMVGPRAVRFSPASSVRGADALGPSASPGGDLVEPASWRPVATPTWERVDVIFWNTGFRSELRHLQPLHLREPGGGIRMVGRVQVARDPRVLLVGHGSSASTLGATRAGREAAQVAVARLGAGARARGH